MFKKLLISEKFPIKLVKFSVPSLSKEYQKADNVGERSFMQEVDKPISHQGVGVHGCKIIEPEIFYHNILPFKVPSNIRT